MLAYRDFFGSHVLTRPDCSLYNLDRFPELNVAPPDAGRRAVVRGLPIFGLESDGNTDRLGLSAQHRSVLGAPITGALKIA